MREPAHPDPGAGAPSGSTTPRVSTDILGEPWVARRIDVVVDEVAAPGADHAVLVHQRRADPGHGAGAPRHARAVLYLHGRSDYFFQTHEARALLAAGYEFYALDLRACGRAGVGLPSPHDVRDLRVHDEEIAEALRIIRSEHGHGEVVLMGHSTGGLQAAIWASDHPGTVEALVLNSPWLQLNASATARSFGSALIDLLSRRAPERVIDNPMEGLHERRSRGRLTNPLHLADRRARERRTERAARAAGSRGADPRPAAGATIPVDADPGPVDEDLYARVLHRRWGGEWDWDLALKPSPSFPVRAGFLAGIRRLQREVRHGLGIGVPVLVCCSTASGGPGTTPEQALRADVVLSAEQIVQRAGCLGPDVTVRRIPGGVHDLALSPSPAREEFLRTVTDWLADRS